MAPLVCCPCGNPIECENLELLVTLECPHCKRELTLEFDDADQRRCRGVLTIMEGPHWVGQRFLAPVGVPLWIGSAPGNWLALDDEQIAERHCELRLTDKGSLVVEDRDSPTGTWVNKNRILRARIADKQSFRVGSFRFRVDFTLDDGSAAKPEAAAEEDTTKGLPRMMRVLPDDTPAIWLARNRFHVGRFLVMIHAWAMAAYHFSWLAIRPDNPWKWYWAGACGLVIGITLSVIGKRIALATPIANYAAMVGLFVLAVLDGAWQMPVAAATSFALLIALALGFIRPPETKRSVAMGLLFIAAVVTVLVLAIPTCVTALTQYISTLQFRWPDWLRFQL